MVEIIFLLQLFFILKWTDINKSQVIHIRISNLGSKIQHILRLAYSKMERRVKNIPGSGLGWERRHSRWVLPTGERAKRRLSSLFRHSHQLRSLSWSYGRFGHHSFSEAEPTGFWVLLSHQVVLAFVKLWEEENCCGAEVKLSNLSSWWEWESWERRKWVEPTACSLQKNM